MRRLTTRRWTFLVFGLVLAAATLQADQQAARRKPITHDVYDGWRSIQGTRISRDGAWLAYALVPQDGDGDLVVRNLRTGAERRHPRGKDPIITSDATFVVFTIAPLKVDVDKAKKDKKKPEEQPKPGLGILNLATGETVTADRVKSFKVPDESGRFVAYLLEPPEKKAEAKEEKKEGEAKPEEKKDAKRKEKKKAPGTDLIVRDLATGAATTIAEVVEYSWSKDGTWLAYGVSSSAKTPEKDGAFVRHTADGVTRALLTGLGNYKGFAFDEKGAHLAFVADRDDYKADTPAFALYLWTAGTEAAAELASATTPGMKPGTVVSEHGKLAFSKDGARLFFGTSAAPTIEPDDPPEPIKVDIWTWKDADLQPMQKVRAEEEKKRNHRAVVHLKERRLVQLASTDMPEIDLSDDGARALGSSDVPYRQLVSWDGRYTDHYIVNLQDGSRRKSFEKARFGATLSPGGNYVLTFDQRDSQWHVERVSDGARVNLTAKLGVRFDDEKADTPEPPRPYGIAGWTDGDRSVLLYDRYDIWELRPDGSAPRMITNGIGRRQKLVFRYQRTEEERSAGRGPRAEQPDEKPISLEKPLLLFTTDETTKATGFYRVTVPAAEPAPADTKTARKAGAKVAKAEPAPPAPIADPVKLVMMDKLVGGLIKAKEAETYVFTEQRFEEFPDLWVSGGALTDVKKVSDANPQQGNYVWGRSELIDYVNADGTPLRAILTKPDDFDPSKKYPLMVYIYEELTDGLHRYTPPAPGTSINVSRYVSNGYVILQPDIIYDTGYPGESALKCVIPAAQRVVSMGFIDPKRIGIQGHSWGGYQITYLITRTDMFRAVEAGAAVSNMISAYGGIRWGTGMSRAFQYERTQSRIGAPPWDSPLQFVENSPIFWVEKVHTPYLTIHNDDDDAVPWYQGIEFFTAMRRLGKEAYLFVYNGEKHGLRERENQKHWTVHMAEFFDHYLLAGPRPEWMDKGVPYLERGTRDLRGIYGEKKATDGRR